MTDNLDFSNWLNSRRSLQHDGSANLDYKLLVQEHYTVEGQAFPDWIYGYKGYVLPSLIPGNPDTVPYKYYKHLPYVFYKDYGNNTYDVTSKELLQYINGYNASNFNGYISHRNVTRDLFMGEVTEQGRKEGYFVQEIDAGELKNLNSYDLSNGWKNIWNALLGKKPTAIPNEFKPLYKVSKDYSCESLYVLNNDASEFNEKMAIAKAKDRSMHMFHFAFTDYFCNALYKDGIFDKKLGYAGQTTAFLDFDIIQVTLSKEGQMTVIPVAMSPIDIVSGTWSPEKPELPNWLKILIIVLIVIVAVLVLSLLFKALGVAGSILKFVIAIIVAPFRFIAWVFSGGKSSKKKKNADVEPTKYDYNKRHKKE